MPKCPRSGARFTWNGLVVAAVPAGFIKGHRSNKTCFEEDGQVLVSVRKPGGNFRYYPPLSELRPVQRVAVTPLTHRATRQHDRMPNLFPQPMPQELQGIEETDTLRLYGSCVKKCRRHAPQSLGPCIDRCQESGGALSGTDDYHAHSASMWATNAVEEAELGAGDALNKGQCNRALESLVRAERKTTMASTNATQTGNERLKAKALASNTLVNALWREFQTKCIRRYPGDHPGSVLPFGGLGGAGSLHERIAAVLGWSVKDTQGFSLSMLREMVRGKDPQLAQEISEAVQSGKHIYQGGLGEARYILPDVE